MTKCEHDWQPMRSEGSLIARCRKCGVTGRLEFVPVKDEDTDELPVLKLAELGGEG